MTRRRAFSEPSQHDTRRINYLQLINTCDEATSKLEYGPR